MRHLEDEGTERGNISGQFTLKSA